jgi:hypothetical protein
MRYIAITPEEYEEALAFEIVVGPFSPSVHQVAGASRCRS